MIEATAASLTVIDAHTAAPKVFWDMEPVESVRNIAVTNRIGASRRVALRITDPEDVSLALTQGEIETRQAQHAAMTAAGIHILLR